MCSIVDPCLGWKLVDVMGITTLVAAGKGSKGIGMDG